MIVTDASVNPFAVAFLLRGGELGPLFEKVGHGKLLELALKAVPLLHQGLEVCGVPGGITESVGEVAGNGFEFIEKSGPLGVKAFLGRSQSRLLFRSEIEVGVEPLVEILIVVGSRGRSRFGIGIRVPAFDQPGGDPGGEAGTQDDEEDEPGPFHSGRRETASLKRSF